MTEFTRTMPVGVVLQRRPGATRWKKWAWRAVAVLPGAGPGNWRELRREGDAVEFHAATAPLELHRKLTEGYLVSLSMDPPSVFVVLRKTGDPERELDLAAVTASAFEAQNYLDSGEEVVEALPMPPGLEAWVRDFVAEHHEEETFIKRKRSDHRAPPAEDGLGDARVRQATDVYRAPRRGRTGETRE